MSIVMTIVVLACIGAIAIRRDREGSDFIATAMAIGLALGVSVSSAPLLADDPSEGGTTVNAEAVAESESESDERQTSSEAAEDSSPQETGVADPLEAGFISTPVEPVTDVTYLDRDGSEPDWLKGQDEEAVTAWSEDGYELRCVASGVELQRPDALAALDTRIQKAVDDYINELLSDSRAAKSVNFEMDDIRNRCLDGEPFVERVIGSVGQTWQAHALLQFDESFDADVHRQWHEIKATNRLLQTGVGAGIVLLLLSTLFGYFRLDTATRGYYTLRLQFATAGTILAIVAASVLAANWVVPWM